MPRPSDQEALSQAIAELVAQNRPYFAADKASRYGVEVQVVSADVAGFDLTLTFQAGERYCCIERGCHLTLDAAWFRKLRERLRAGGIDNLPSLTIRKLQVVVEEGAFSDGPNRTPRWHESRLEYQEGPFFEADAVGD